MLKIIHAADFHLDSPFAALSEEQAALRRREQRQLLASLAEAAEGADIVLLPGDLLDSGVCHAETVEALEGFLNALPGRVFVAPGNHDYYAKFPRHTEIPVLFFATLSQLIFNLRNLNNITNKETSGE